MPVSVFTTMNLLGGLALTVFALQGLGTTSQRTYPSSSFEGGMVGYSRLRMVQLIPIKSTADYQRYNKTVGRVTETPAVDWSNYELLAVHLGPAPSTGYGIVVKRVFWVNPTTVKVDVLTSKPQPGTMQAMHVTYPFAIIRIQRLPKNTAYLMPVSTKPYQSATGLGTQGEGPAS